MGRSRDRGGPTRRHALQMWLSAGAIVVLAAVVAVSINALHTRADRERQVELLAAHIGADAQHVSRIEWQATAERRLSPQLAEEFQRVDRHVREDLDAYDRVGTAGARQLSDRRRALPRSGRASSSRCSPAGASPRARRSTASEVDASFDRLQDRLRLDRRGAQQDRAQGGLPWQPRRDGQPAARGSDPDRGALPVRPGPRRGRPPPPAGPGGPGAPGRPHRPPQPAQAAARPRRGGRCGLPAATAASSSCAISTASRPTTTASAIWRATCCSAA